MAAQKVRGVADGAARRAETGLTTHAALMKNKNASWGRWVGGWPIYPNVDGSDNPVPTSISVALAALSKGAVDLFKQAVTPTNSSGSAQILSSGMPGQGQQYWNNFLGNNQRCFNTLYPEAGGVYPGTLWDMVSGLPAAQGPMSTFMSGMVENCILILQKNQNNEAFMPWLMTPPGIRLDRRVSQTLDNVLLTTEGFGSMDGRGLKRFRDDERWSKATQLGLQLTPSIALQALITSLTTEMIPIQGTEIVFVAHGVEMRKIIVGG